MNKLINSSVILLLFVAVSQPATLKAQSVQRLFSTPAKRAELDRLRFQLSQPGVIDKTPVRSESAVEAPAFTEEADVVYSLGGTMQKSDGSYTVWINDTAYDQTSLPDNMELLAPFSKGQLRIHDRSSGAMYDVKPGQVLNLSTGELFESYQYRNVLDTAASMLEAALSSGDSISEPLNETIAEVAIE
jgi:hypothetical protein